MCQLYKQKDFVKQKLVRYLAVEKLARFNSLLAVKWYEETTAIAKKFKAKQKINKFSLSPVLSQDRN